MLKPSEIYTVAICLNTRNWGCTLLSKPDGATLLAMAEVEENNADKSLIEALTFVGDIAIPQPYDEAAETTIIVAGVEIGTISVETSLAYTMTHKRVRKTQDVSTQTTE